MDCPRIAEASGDLPQKLFEESTVIETYFKALMYSKNNNCKVMTRGACTNMVLVSEQ